MEIEVIEKNDTWELTNLPIGEMKVDVKWVYKMKFNENGEELQKATFHIMAWTTLSFWDP